MKNKIFLSLSVFIFLLIFIVFYKGLHKTNIYIPQVDLDRPLPKLSSELLYSEKTINYSEIFNSEIFYLLNIWSSWCVPCRDEHYLLIELSKNNNIGVVGLNYKDNNANAKKYLNELGNPYKKILIDIDGSQAIEWGAFGVPESFLIHKNKIVKKFIGPLDEDLLNEIKSLIE